jgi:hypothetical protein
VYQDFEVDLWFCYGSFNYGVEGQILDWKDQSLSVSLPASQNDTQNDILEFLEGILEKPKGLLRIDIRLYIQEKYAKKYKIEGPLYLFSDTVPKLLDYDPQNPVLLFSRVQGISPTHTQNWQSLRQKERSL